MPVIKRGQVRQPGTAEYVPPEGAEVKSVSSSSTVAPKPALPQARKKLFLSVEKTKPYDQLYRYVILLYGKPKIGKTSFCSMFPDPTFLMFEPGGNALEIERTTIPDWLGFRDAIEHLENGHHAKTVVVDTVDICFQRCQEYICSTMGIKHPGDLQYGKGWNALATEFATWMNRLLALRDLEKGVILTSHHKPKEVSLSKTEVIEVIEPSMVGQAQTYAEGACDIIGFYGYYGNERKLVIRGNENLVAGCRLEKNFVAKNGKPIVSIPMGKSSAESYKNLLQAFNNQQDTEDIVSYPEIRKIEKKTM